MKTINWTHEMFTRFKKRYAQAVSEKQGAFVFDDNEFVTSYATHLIECLTGKFK